MKTAAQTTFAERAGRTVGRLWRGCVRLDRRAAQALVAKGWEPGVAKGVMLLVKMAAFGVLLYMAFWLALILAVIVLAVIVLVGWSGRNMDAWEDEDKPEWREGHSGFGLYDKSEWRHDMGDPDKH